MNNHLHLLPANLKTVVLEPDQILTRADIDNCRSRVSGALQACLAFADANGHRRLKGQILNALLALRGIA